MDREDQGVKKKDKRPTSKKNQTAPSQKQKKKKASQGLEKSWGSVKYLYSAVV